jgi:hypothetical protein
MVIEIEENMGTKPRKLTGDEDRLHIANLYQSGYTLEEVAEFFRVSVGPIRAALYELGIPRRPRHKRRKNAVYAELGKRMCGKCGEVKPLADFSRASDKMAGYQYICKECMKHKSLRRLPKKYGITAERYFAMLSTSTVTVSGSLR